VSVLHVPVREIIVCDPQSGLCIAEEIHSDLTSLCDCSILAKGRFT
jgi:hypothetical protein